METITTKRNTWVACPKCGHKVAKVRTCDMEVKCKRCGHEFEAIISSTSHTRTEGVTNNIPDGNKPQRQKA